MTTNQQPFTLSDGNTTARYPFTFPGHEPMGIRFLAMPYVPPAQPSQLDAVLVRPNAYTAQMGRKYPRVYRALYRQHGESRQSWPDWCFVPTPIVRRELATDIGISLDSAIEVIRDAPIVAGLAAWRVTKGVYDFHPTLLDSLWTSDIVGDLPIDMFRYLPEWCVYIPVDPPRDGIRGCFAFVDEDDEDWFPRKLILLVDQDEALVEVEIELKAGADILASMPLFSGYNLSGGLAQPRLEPLLMTDAERQNAIPLVRNVVTPLVSLVMYLCLTNVELTAADRSDSRPGKPAVNRSGRGPVFDTPAEPRKWGVAYRMGAAIQRGSASAGGGASGSTPTGRARMRPHIRRAHWHRYWTGPRSEPDNRRLLARWLPPIPVAIDDDPDDIITTVREID